MALLASESLGDANRAGKDGHRGTGELSRGALGVAMNLPTIGLLLLVLAYPVVYAGYLSLHRVGIAQLRRGVFPWNNGDNYARLLEDPLFALALKNTILFTLLVVGVEVVLAIAIALLLNQASLWTSRLARLLILIPYGVPPITNGLIWSFMYSFQFGFLNRLLFSSGLINEPVNWAGNPDTALYAVAVAYIWRTLPFAVLIVHAALQGIPREDGRGLRLCAGAPRRSFRDRLCPAPLPADRVTMEPRGLPRLLMHFANGLVILFIMLPIVAVVLGSLQPERTLQGESRRVIPSEWTLDNFTVILTQGQQKGRIFEQATYLPDNIKSFYRAFANSLIVALGVTLLTVGFGALSAYTVARLELRWALWLMQANVVARFLPAIVLMIPLYVVVRSLGQLNTLHAVVLTETGFLLPYAIVILVPFFATIPADLEDAARIDGCTHFQAFWRIILPLSAPGLAACAVIMFIISWHELLIPLILNSPPEFMTLPVIVASLVGDVHVFFNLLMAICLLSLLPTVILVALLQRYVVEGLAAGAVKG